MADSNSDEPSGPLANVPDRVNDGELVGVDETGVPIYFDESEDRAFEALQSRGTWTVGEERKNADLADIVAEIDRVIGWAALSDLGERARDE